MLLTRQQVTLLHSLQTVIEVEWKIKIGYSCPAGSFVDDSNQFIIWESRINSEIPLQEDSEDNWEPHLIHRLDFHRTISGIFCREGPVDVPLHEDRVVEFWERLQAALMNGEIYHEPGVHKTLFYEGESIEVDCTKLANGSFSFWIKDDIFKSGFTRTLEQLRATVEKNQNRDPKRWEQIPPDIQAHILREDFKDRIALEIAEDLHKRGMKR